MITKTKSITLKQTNGNEGLYPAFSLADVLPAVCSPWFSMGDVDTLRRIGEVLDTIDPTGSEDPNWGAAMKIVQIHRQYTRQDAGYAAAYERSPSGLYAPGTVAATPIFDGRYNKWRFEMRLTAAVGRTVTAVVGLNGAGYSVRETAVDFKTPSESSAGEVKTALTSLGVRFDAYEVEVEDEYENAA